MITIYTPAFNRASTLPRVFNSLLEQSCYDFEWLLINDGSTDNTEDVIKKFNTDKFLITIINKENGGLPSVMNLAPQIAKGDFILRLDSDDYLDKLAIETIVKYIPEIKKDSNICGMVFLTKFDNGKVVGYHPFPQKQISNFYDYRYIHGAIGDRAEVIKTSILKQYSLPIIKGEKFCPEGVLWLNIAKKYNALYINTPIYIREYNDDSITAAGSLTSIKNPIGTFLYSSLIINGKGKFKYIKKDYINYFRYALNTHYSIKKIITNAPIKASFIGLIPGCILYVLDKCNPRLISILKKKL